MIVLVEKKKKGEKEGALDLYYMYKYETQCVIEFAEPLPDNVASACDTHTSCLVKKDGVRRRKVKTISGFPVREKNLYCLIK